MFTVPNPAAMRLLLPILLLLPGFCCRAQTLRFGLAGAYAFNHARNTSQLSTTNVHGLTAQVSTDNGPTGGLQFRLELRPNLFVDIQPRYARMTTRYALETGVPESFRVSWKWQKTSHHLVVPVGLSRCLPLNANVAVQGLLRQYVGLAFDSYSPRETSVLGYYGLRSIDASNHGSYPGQFPLLLGAEAGLGVVLRQRGLELNVLCSVPERRLDRQRLRATVTYEDAAGPSQFEVTSQPRAAVVSLLGQLVLYWK